MSKELPHISLNSPTFKGMSDCEKAGILFGSTHRIVDSNSSRWREANRAEYDRLRNVAKEQLHVSMGANPLERANERVKNSTYHQPTPAPDVETMQAMRDYDKARCVQMLEGTGASQLMEASSDEYRRFQRACKAHGVIANPTVHVSDVARGHNPALPKPTPSESTVTFEELRERILSTIPKP